MKLDRNMHADGRGKYALIKLRDIRALDEACHRMAENALEVLCRLGVVDLGLEGEDSEFFLLRLKDKYAPAALFAYSEVAAKDGQLEWSEEVCHLAHKSVLHPSQKQPD